MVLGGIKVWNVCNLSTHYRSGTAKSNTVNSKFHLIRSFNQVLNTAPIFSMLKNTVKSNTVNSKFH